MDFRLKSVILSKKSFELTKLLEESTEDVIVEKDKETITDYLLDIDNVKIKYNIAEGKLIEVVNNLNI